MRTAAMQRLTGPARTYEKPPSLASSSCRRFLNDQDGRLVGVVIALPDHPQRPAAERNHVAGRPVRHRLLSADAAMPHTREAGRRRSDCPKCRPSAFPTGLLPAPPEASQPRFCVGNGFNLLSVLAERIPEARKMGRMAHDGRAPILDTRQGAGPRRSPRTKRAQAQSLRQLRVGHSAPLSDGSVLVETTETSTGRQSGEA
jgi:hypothetical protein